MAESIKIIYQPIINRVINQPGTQHKNIDLTFDSLSGFILMVFQYVKINQVLISKTSGEIIDIEQFIRNNPYILAYGSKLDTSSVNWFASLQSHFMIDPQQIKYPYTCIIVNKYYPNRNILVQFPNFDFLAGAIFMCKLFGLNWLDFILEVHRGEEPYIINTDFYLGKIRLLGHGISELKLLYQQMMYETMDSLSKSLYECFDKTEIGVILPSNIVVAASDTNYHNIISSAAVTTSLIVLPIKYRIPRSHYIFNVCTKSDHRGKGLSKSVLIALINNILSMGFSTIIYLEVDPLNLSAYNLYISLGFVKIDETISYGKRFHLLQMRI